MKTIKLHTFVVRLAHNHEEVFLLCGSPERARQAYEALMPKSAPSFDPSMGAWVKVDINPAAEPTTAAPAADKPVQPPPEPNNT